MAFDSRLARDVALPLTGAAYSAMNGQPLDLPKGFVETALIQADQDNAPGKPDSGSTLVEAMTKSTGIFGLVGQNEDTKTAFVSFRGTQDLDDWIHDFDAETADYQPRPGYGQVHAGFQEVYRLVRGSLAANLATACQGCTQLLLTGHSLGAALAVLAAPDVRWNMPPQLEPRLITFAGPRVGLPDFVNSFNTDIEACFRVVNLLDIVPHVPGPPYVHVGAEIDVDSGGDWRTRHSLDAYRIGIDKLPSLEVAA
jgi:hypothetical protein